MHILELDLKYRQCTLLWNLNMLIFYIWSFKMNRYVWMDRECLGFYHRKVYMYYHDLHLFTHQHYLDLSLFQTDFISPDSSLLYPNTTIYSKKKCPPPPPSVLRLWQPFRADFPTFTHLKLRILSYFLVKLYLECKII